MDNSTGVNSDACLSDQDMPCKTLDFALEHLKSNTEIILLPGFQILTEKKQVSNLENISIVANGSMEETVINCTNSGAGMEFVHVRNLVINGLWIRNCGSLQQSTSRENENSTFYMFRSAVYVLNCTSVSVFGCNFVHNYGLGMVIFDTNGLVDISFSRFINNSVPSYEVSDYPGGGGLYIEHSTCSPSYDNDAIPCGTSPFANGSDYTILNCTFHNNTATNLPNASTIVISKKGPTLSRLSIGGGMKIALRGYSSNNWITISECYFDRNHAFLGGALVIQISDRAASNYINLKGGTMFNNHASHGGGAIEFGIYNEASDDIAHNRITTENITFSSNHAQYGGGVGFYSSRRPTFHPFYYVSFLNCTWTLNTAAVGAAIVMYPEDWSYMSEGSLPVPVFHNCQFIGNQLISFKRETHEFIHHQTPKSQLNWGSGIIYSDTFTINVSGNVTFIGNVGSCIHISAALINVLNSSNLLFNSNYALRGAGLSLVGYAALMAHENSSVSFFNNTADDVGGAVYYSTIDHLDFVNSRRCFFRYPGYHDPDDWLAKFSFVNNTAKNYGHAIYATTLLPCIPANGMNSTRNFNKVFVDWNSFHFQPKEIKFLIATDPATIITRSHFNISTSPGNVTDLQLTLTDDLNQTVNSILFASCDSKYLPHSCDDIDLRGSEYISNNKIVIKGNLNKSLLFNLRVTTITSRPIARLINITLNLCPPGFYLNDSVCKCATAPDSSQGHELPGILACDEKQQHAYLEIGYWAGLYKDKPATAECPAGYCKYKKSDGKYNGEILLPSNYNLINELLCAEANRDGLTCGLCKVNYSVFYHSGRYNCEKCNYPIPGLGILFYFLSELVPLTVIFLIVIIFDINLMSGIANSFIFFAQTMDFYQVTLPNYKMPEQFTQLTEVYWFIIGFFNLEFFRTDALSFCLFHGARTLDILVFKYVTTAFGLLLICLLVALMKVFRCHKFLGKCRKNSESSQYTVMNGLTAFLVLTYSQCAKVSFELLSQLKIYVDNGNEEFEVHYAVQLEGNIPYFHTQHLKFAIPAIIVLCYLLIVPIFLVCHPLYSTCMRKITSRELGAKICSSKCKTNCSFFTLLTKPILDAFQSPYKDDARFFAGMAFFYRLLMAGLFAFDPTALNAFASLLVFLIFILMVRTVFHPYRIRIHNTVESLIFADLAFINGITLYNSISSQIQPENHQKYFQYFLAIQLVLIYIPIIGISVYATVKCAQYFRILRSFGCDGWLQDSRDSRATVTTVFDPVDQAAVNASNSFDESRLPARLFDSSKSINTRSTTSSMREGGYGSFDFNNNS